MPRNPPQPQSHRLDCGAALGVNTHATATGHTNHSAVFTGSAYEPNIESKIPPALETEVAFSSVGGV
jgi:hypothetical protein